MISIKEPKRERGRTAAARFLRHFRRRDDVLLKLWMWTQLLMSVAALKGRGWEESKNLEEREMSRASDL